MQLTLPQVCIVIFSIFSIMAAAVSAGNILWAKKGVEEKVEYLQMDMTEVKSDLKIVLKNSISMQELFDQAAQIAANNSK